MNLVTRRAISEGHAKGHVRQGHLNGHVLGFTLIELLVVIAIIGILSSVVLASLNTARNKGNDAAIKSNLSEARTQAEIWYDGNSNSYSGVCGTTALANGTRSINASVLAAGGGTGLTAAVTVNGAGAAAQATCNATAAEWAAETPLKTGGFYCVDHTGYAGYTAASTLTTSSDTDCN